MGGGGGKGTPSTSFIYPFKRLYIAKHKLMGEWEKWQWWWGMASAWADNEMEGPTRRRGNREFQIGPTLFGPAGLSMIWYGHTHPPAPLILDF